MSTFIHSEKHSVLCIIDKCKFECCSSQVRDKNKGETIKADNDRSSSPEGYVSIHLKCFIACLSFEPLLLLFDNNICYTQTFFY